jgi:hypothetical protein
MRKSELVYRQLLLMPETTQLELSRTLGISLSTVNAALRPLRGMGAVRVGQRKLSVVDREKLLLYWASVRNLRNDLCYSTRFEAPVDRIEKSMPPDVLFTAYSGYKFRHGDVPADYSEVYVYGRKEGLESVEKRFPASKKTPNLFVLETDGHLVEVSKNNIVPDAQLFVDLWNLPEWYAKEFVTRLRERIM